MSELLILRLSPHRGGASDLLAEYFAQGLGAGAYPVRSLALRDLRIIACDGCNACRKEPYRCKYEGKDELSQILSALRSAILAVFVAPIYFYALPAPCMAFIDRAQALWNRSMHEAQTGPFPPGIALFAAARAKGPRLFTGASLCLSCFLNSLGSALLARYGFRNLEDSASLAARPGLKAFLKDKGREWARYAALNSGS